MERQEGAEVEREIFSKLPDHQQRLVDIIGSARAQSGRWPTYDYIERTFRQDTGGNALTTMALLPSVRANVGPEVYHLVFSEGGSWGRPADRHGLTIGGMSHFPELVEDAAQLVSAISLIAARDAQVTPDPDGVVALEMSVDEVLTHLGPFVHTGRTNTKASPRPWRWSRRFGELSNLREVTGASGTRLGGCT